MLSVLLPSFSSLFHNPSTCLTLWICASFPSCCANFAYLHTLKLPFLICTSCIVSPKGTSFSSSFKLQALCYHTTCRNTETILPWPLGQGLVCPTVWHTFHTGGGFQKLVGHAQKEELGGCAHLSSETTNTPSSKRLSLLWRDTETPTVALPYWAESLWRCASFAKCCLELGWGGKPFSFRLTWIQYAVPCLQPSQQKLLYTCSCRCLPHWLCRQEPAVAVSTQMSRSWRALSQRSVLMLNLNESPGSLSIYGMSKSPITMAAKHRGENAADWSRSGSSTCKT